MNHLFQMSMPWWGFAFRGILVYLVLMLYLRLTDKRSLGDMSTFDMVVLMVIGGTLRTAIVGNDKSLIGPLIAVAAMLVVDKLLAWSSARWPWMSGILEAAPSVLVRQGRRDKQALKKNDIPDRLFDREMRLAGMESEEDVAIARLEGNGKISWIRRKRSK
jgi:uncharacterized membrane protein YcaP (DUF421 family)